MDCDTVGNSSDVAVNNSKDLMFITASGTPIMFEPPPDETTAVSPYQVHNENQSNMDESLLFITGSGTPMFADLRHTSVEPITPAQDTTHDASGGRGNKKLYPTAYLNFYTSLFKKKAYKGKRVGEVSHQAGILWKCMNKNQKKPYISMAMVAQRKKIGVASHCETTQQLEERKVLGKDNPQGKVNVKSRNLDGCRISTSTVNRAASSEGRKLKKSIQTPVKIKCEPMQAQTQPNSGPGRKRKVISGCTCSADGSQLDLRRTLKVPNEGAKSCTDSDTCYTSTDVDVCQRKVIRKVPHKPRVPTELTRKRKVHWEESWLSSSESSVHPKRTMGITNCKDKTYYTSSPSVSSSSGDRMRTRGKLKKNARTKKY